MLSYYSAEYIRLSLENEAVQLVVIRHAKTYVNSRMNIKVNLYPYVGEIKYQI